MVKLNPYFQSLQNSIYGSEARSPIANLLTNINSNAEAQITAINNQAENHRNIFRGKQTNSGFTDAFKIAIANGTFDDIYVGDIWRVNNAYYEIVDIDYFYGIGREPLNVHHVVIIPRTSFDQAQMNDTDTTVGAYAGSQMRSDSGYLKTTVTESIENAFGSAYILNHDEYLENSINSEKRVNGTAWYTCRVELLSERMIYGHNICSRRDDTVVLNYSDLAQFARFRIKPQPKVGGRTSFWLRDVCVTDGHGRFCTWQSASAAGHLPTTNLRVLPYFLVCGTPQS